MTLMLDISRLLSRQRFATPTGIDRFELAYARWVLQSGRDAAFVETGTFRPTVVPGRSARSLIEHVARRWAPCGMSTDEARVLDAILAAIDGHRPWQAQGLARHGGRTPRSSPAVASLTRAARRLANSWMRCPAQGTYLHVSHARLHRPAAFGWLGPRRPAVFYVHDLIPISHPEFVRVGEPERHMRRMQTVLRHAGLVLCNSRSTAATLDRLAERHGLPQPRSAVLPPGVDDAFLEAPTDRPVSTARPYFVCVGTIEPRKNHALLLKVWRRLVERHGDAAPRLVIVGRRGWDNAELFELLDRPGPLHQAVIELPDLSDAPLSRLLAGAAALLTPSIIEGYGMPVAEALALGTPVIASDIASHREIAGTSATLVDPLDGPAWLQAIEAHALRHSGRRARERKATRSNWTWSDHFQALDRLLAAGDLVALAGRARAHASHLDGALWGARAPVGAPVAGW